jgi:hypothetical protein
LASSAGSRERTTVLGENAGSSDSSATAIASSQWKVPLWVPMVVWGLHLSRTKKRGNRWEKNIFKKKS